MNRSTHESEVGDPPQRVGDEEVAFEHVKEVSGGGDEALAGNGGGDCGEMRELLKKLKDALRNNRGTETIARASKVSGLSFALKF